jgi:hypothetical protein
LWLASIGTTVPTVNVGVDSLICRPVHSLDAVEPLHDRGGAADPAAHAAEVCARIACGNLLPLPRTGMQALTLR